MTQAKVVRTISPDKLKVRCDAARRERNAMPLTWRPFAEIKGMVKPVKASK